MDNGGGGRIWSHLHPATSSVVTRAKRIPLTSRSCAALNDTSARPGPSPVVVQRDQHEVGRPPVFKPGVNRAVPLEQLAPRGATRTSAPVLRPLALALPQARALPPCPQRLRADAHAQLPLDALRQQRGAEVGVLGGPWPWPAPAPASPTAATGSTPAEHRPKEDISILVRPDISKLVRHSCRTRCLTCGPAQAKLAEAAHPDLVAGTRAGIPLYRRQERCTR